MAAAMRTGVLRCARGEADEKISGLDNPKWFHLSARSSLPNCPGGGIGRHTRLRGVCRKACRFESCPGHHSSKKKTSESDQETGREFLLSRRYGMFRGAEEIA